VLFSSQNSCGVRVLSNAYADAREFVQSISPRKLSDHEETLLSRRITRNLMDAHDSGEREPGELRRAALLGVLAAGIWN
jgi:hypothetical protein